MKDKTKPEVAEGRAAQQQSQHVHRTPAQELCESASGVQTCKSAKIHKMCTHTCIQNA